MITRRPEAGSQEDDRRHDSDASQNERGGSPRGKTEGKAFRLAAEPPMLIRLVTGPGVAQDAVKFYVECVCKACSRRFRFHIPIPAGQTQPRRCPHCDSPFSEQDALYLNVFVNSMTAGLFAGAKRRPLVLTGTCANCESRLRFNAREICDLDSIHCPHCGFDLGEDGKKKLIEHARKLLGKRGD